MIRNRLGAAILGSALFLGSTALGAESPEQLDAQCMVRADAAQAALPPQNRANATVFVFYYMGRMVGRNPKVDIPARVKEATAALLKDSQHLIPARCDKELQEIMARYQKTRRP